MRGQGMGNSKGKRPALSAAQKRNARRVYVIDWISWRTPGWLARDWKDCQSLADKREIWNASREVWGQK